MDSMYRAMVAEKIRYIRRMFPLYAFMRNEQRNRIIRKIVFSPQVLSSLGR